MNRVKALKSFRIITNILVGALVFTMALIIASSAPVFADEAATGAEIPKDAESYTLTYPDGTVITENEQGEPLTYDDVVRLMNDENWRLMARGLVSDENGEIPLPATWEKGTIKIIETKVPEGYTQGEVSEIIAELEDGIATFVNPKVKDPTPAAKTGDTSDIVLWTGVLGLAMASAWTLRAHKDRS